MRTVIPVYLYRCCCLRQGTAKSSFNCRASATCHVAALVDNSTTTPANDTPQPMHRRLIPRFKPMSLYYLLLLQCAASEIRRINETLLLLIADTGVFRALRQSQEYKTSREREHAHFLASFYTTLISHATSCCERPNICFITQSQTKWVFSILSVLWFKQLCYQQLKKLNTETKQKMKNEEKLSYLLPTKLCINTGRS